MARGFFILSQSSARARGLTVNGDLIPSRPGRPRTTPSSNRMQPCKELAELFNIPMFSEEEIKRIKRAEATDALRDTYGKITAREKKL